MGCHARAHGMSRGNGLGGGGPAGVRGAGLVARLLRLLGRAADRIRAARHRDRRRARPRPGPRRRRPWRRRHTETPDPAGTVAAVPVTGRTAQPTSCPEIRDESASPHRHVAAGPDGPGGAGADADVPCERGDRRTRPDQSRRLPGLLRLRLGGAGGRRAPDHSRSGRSLPADGRGAADHRHRPHRHLRLGRVQPRAVAAPRRGGGGRAGPPGRAGHRHRHGRPGRGGPAGADRRRGARAAQPPGRDRGAAAAPGPGAGPRGGRAAAAAGPSRSPTASPSRSARSTATTSARPTARTAATRPRTTWSAPSWSSGPCRASSAGSR